MNIQPTVFDSVSKVIHNELDDSNACAVIAFSIVTGMSPEIMQKAFSLVGRKKGRGVRPTMIHEVLQGFSIPHEWLHGVRQPNGSHYTPKTIGRYCHKGKYIAFSRSHALAVVDGIVHDWTDGRKHRIIHLLKIG
jgi:hypothetical protein